MRRAGGVCARSRRPSRAGSPESDDARVIGLYQRLPVESDHCRHPRCQAIRFPPTRARNTRPADTPRFCQTKAKADAKKGQTKAAKPAQTARAAVAKDAQAAARAAKLAAKRGQPAPGPAPMEGVAGGKKKKAKKGVQLHTCDQWRGRRGRRVVVKAGSGAGPFVRARRHRWL